jgi:3-hydroxyisobutyrate dehydrogenase
MTRVAFLGLGAIGAPMAGHLVNPPFDLTVWNRTAQKAEEFARDHTARAAATPAAAVRDAEFVITCLPSSREVGEVLSQPDGILSGIATHSVLIDCTSGDPAASREFAAALGQRDVAFIDAPVSGGVAGAKAGALTVMCGADGNDLERARSVLEAFGKKIVHCGPVGSGHAVKSLSNRAARSPRLGSRRSFDGIDEIGSRARQSHWM